MIVGVIGLGLIGGSMAIDLKRRGFAGTVLGVETDPVNAAAARKMELVDEVVPFGECIRRSDITVIAIPVGAAVRMLPQVLDIFKEEGNSKKIVIDTCSTKSNIVRAAHYHPMRGRFVATHPMAGTEYSGPWAAMPNLFDGRACIFANTEDSDPQAVKVVEELYDALNMRPLYMNADSHDVHTAYVSHISHVTSFALALTVLEKEREERYIFDLAGGGFESTVRLAKSAASTWVPILLGNKYNVLDVLREHIHQLEIMRRMIERDDAEGLTSAMERANSIERILR